MLASDVPLGALIVEGVVGRSLLIERQILRRLRYGDVEHLDDVRAIDPALPEQAKLDEFEPTLNAPLQCRQAFSHPSLPPNGCR